MFFLSHAGRRGIVRSSLAVSNKIVLVPIGAQLHPTLPSMLFEKCCAATCSHAFGIVLKTSRCRSLTLPGSCSEGIPLHALSCRGSCCYAFAWLCSAMRSLPLALLRRCLRGSSLALPGRGREDVGLPVLRCSGFK